MHALWACRSGFVGERLEQPSGSTAFGFHNVADLLIQTISHSRGSACSYGASGVANLPETPKVGPPGTLFTFSLLFRV